ncbi:Serine/threonine-protein kinase PrkC [Gemmata sp. SH-PL17]|uniref:serine/threonine-protein kinase n=1 Tax=Gemmata sp. SH-PL17 TaxID=1630693 RepID=UPI00078CE53B|nr:serine/threonine-protein kinase [Gemmata sp. SH-PL17]AMV29824.1 Serine/threonine-protein kinase PrkC [Gemmata sp. SH-PL17]
MAMKFTYRSGQRPLDGFTLKRGVGQGAFGEVYFAVSDGGKEVALKLLTRGHTDAELRGVAHCINLKHPNLVHLFDLRVDSRSDQWVVMEYVFGESLAHVINKHPTGLPTQVIREWFAALCRGVGYLHNQGVVHRDLKPGNIFIEHGHLKIGDYGLSRRISGSEGSDLSRGVGTPYYMAPEIKNGNYTASIDIYACGIILYEMITGLRPFNGETPYEVLIKHITETPDLTKLPVPYREVLGRALEKDPAKRFSTAAELARAVEEMFAGGRRDPEMSTAASLTPTLPRARPVPPPLPIPAPPLDVPSDAVRPVAFPVPRDTRTKEKQLPSGPLTQTARDRLTELAGGFALTPLITAACTAPWAVFQGAVPWSLLGRVFVLSTVLAWAVMAIGRLPKRSENNPWGRRAIQLVVGLCIGAMAFWLDGWALPTGTANASSRDIVAFNHRLSQDTFGTGMKYLVYFGVTVAVSRWWTTTNRNRRERVRFIPIIAIAFWGSIFLFLWPTSESTPAMLGISVLVIATIAAQVASPWAGPPLKSARA